MAMTHVNDKSSLSIVVRMKLCTSEIAFIGCMPRSGSTLLRVMIDTHPKVFAGKESHFVTRNMRYFFDDIEKAKSQECLFVHKSPPVISADGLNKICSLVKSPRIINIKRNPEDILSSYLKSLKRKITILNFCPNVDRYVQGLIWLEQNFSQVRYHELTYESLIKNPEIELKQICEFLGLSYDPIMVEYYKYDHERSGAYSDKMAMRPIFNSSIDQFDEYRSKIENHKLTMECLTVLKKFQDRPTLPSQALL